MINSRQFERIKRKHGRYASWAVWANAEKKPTSNMEDLSDFDGARALRSLRNDVVMVGLNLSRSTEPHKPFSNFHGKGGGAFKIRYAFKDTRCYGAYMTDIIKDLVEVDAKKTMKCSKSPEVVTRNVKTFRQELRDLRAAAPIILAFGNDTYEILLRNLDKSEYRKLIKLKHYSCWISKEKYKEDVLKQLMTF